MKYFYLQVAFTNFPKARAWTLKIVLLFGRIYPLTIVNLIYIYRLLYEGTVVRMTDKKGNLII